MDKRLKHITFSAVLLAAALLLPLLTGNDRELGNALCLMHIPVLVCGFICGPVWGSVIGFCAPLLRGLIFGAPPFMPVGVCMAFELAAYGLFTGVLYKLLPKKLPYLYVSLIVSMLCGRLVWGLAQYIVLGAQGNSFTLTVFWTNGFVNALPGIALHIALIPLLITAIKKSGFIKE